MGLRMENDISGNKHVAMADLIKPGDDSNKSMSGTLKRKINVTLVTEEKGYDQL